MNRIKLPAFVRAFAGAKRGAVAVWFGLSFPVIAMGSLMAIDFSRASTADQTLQAALDAANLIAARSSATTTDAIDAAGDAALTAMLAGNTGLTTIGGLTPNAQGRISGVTFTLTGSIVTATASATVTPIVASAFLGGPMNIHANSTVSRAVNKLEIAMVLDTTGSMQGTKLTNLITAAKSFVTSMETAAAASTVTNPVKISIVPFSTTVKVQDALSMSSYNTTTFTVTNLPTWMDGRARSTPWDKDIFTLASSSATRVDRFAMLKNIGVSWGGCVEARKAPYDIRETAPVSTDVDTLFTPWFWPDESDSNSDYLNDYLNDVNTGTWSQRQGYSPKYNTTTLKTTGTFIPSSLYGAAWTYGPNAACNMQKIMHLSTNFTTLRSHIDGLVASGETNVPLGLMWGWHTISPNAPFAEGSAYNTPNLTKIIVLMTDGDNTMNASGSNNSNASWYHGYGYIWQNKLGITSGTGAERTTKMDERMVAPDSNPTQEALCSNIKTQGIIIYTVGVGVSSDAEELLTDCASQASYYYDVDSSGTNMSTVFNTIAGSIQNLRITH